MLTCSTEVLSSEISRRGVFNLDECMSIHFVLDKSKFVVHYPVDTAGQC